MGVASGSGWLSLGVVSNQEVGVGGIYGCGCKEVYRFPHIIYPYSSCICLFCSIPTFCSFFLFFVLVRIRFCNLCNNFFAQYKHRFYILRYNIYGINTHTGDYGRPTEVLHITNKHTQTKVSYPVMD